MAAPTPVDLARALAGWGALVEVVEPPAVRDELARIGAELARRYPDARLEPQAQAAFSGGGR